MAGRTAPARVTAAQLLAAAERDGHPISRRLLTDWVAIGLLDRATPTGRGRGKGKTYTWPAEQRSLLLTLLAHHKHTPRTALLNIPVVTWLIWGDAYVPLRQARRALATWAGQHQTSSWTKAQTTAREVLAQLDHPNAEPSDRARLTELVARVGYSGQLDEDELTNAARRVFDPHGTGLTRGPLGIIDADQYVKTVVARAAAIQAIPSAPDALYRQARADYLTIGPVADHARAPLDINGYVLSPRQLGATTNPPTLSEITNRACLDLLTLLGLNLTEARPAEPVPPPRWPAPKRRSLKPA